MEAEKITIELPSRVLESARKRAKDDRRSFDGYIAFLIAQDTAVLGEPVISVTAPDNIREYVPVVFEGEDADLVDQRNKVMNALLTASGR